MTFFEVTVRYRPTLYGKGAEVTAPLTWYERLQTAHKLYRDPV